MQFAHLSPLLKHISFYLSMEATFVITEQHVQKQEPEALHSSANPTPIQTLFLSNIDQTVAFPVEMLFFFKAAASATLDIYERVSRSMTEVLLNHYYFLAGRLHLESKTKRLELVCNNEGVMFVRATSCLSVDDLGDVSLPNPSFKHLLLRTDAFNGLDQTPVFSIQVTRFACGGFSIGFVTNHSILDGRSAAEMMENLASVCRGEGMKKTFRGLDNDRTCIKARDPLQIKYKHEEYIKLTDLHSSSFTSPDVQPVTPASHLQLSETHSYRVFSFTPAMIDNLKHNSSAAKCSTFEAIVAHIWKARTQSVFTEPDQTSSVLFAVDVRSKITPPLAANFIGNAVITARASAIASDVWRMPLSACVARVKEAIEGVTDEYVRSVVDWLEVHRGVPAAVGGNFYVSAWWKLLFHELDFGYGKAVYGGPVVSGMDEFVLLLADGKGRGGVNVWMVLQKEAMERFVDCVYDFN